VKSATAQELRGAVPTGVLRLIPEGFAADHLREVAPDLEPRFSQTKCQPQRERVVLRIGVTDEDRIPVYAGDRRCWAGSSRN
jgi:hypothetical protein